MFKEITCKQKKTNEKPLTYQKQEILLGALRGQKRYTMPPLQRRMGCNEVQPKGETSPFYLNTKKTIKTR